MSTPCTSPININSTDPSMNECNVYCTYGYDYNDSVCVVSRDPSGNYLDIKYDLKNSGTNSQVIFNGESYNVTSLRLYQPSLHTYDGKQAPVELLIFHDGGVSNKLVISIPYQSGSGSTSYTSSKIGGQILETIINDYSKFSLSSSSSSSSSNTQNLNITNFNLNNFIPNSQYYYYVGTELLNSGVCSQPKSTNYILFDLTKGGQYISSDAISTLQNLISKSAFPIQTNTLYKSAKFPNSNSAAAKSSEIYIDCNPAGSEGEEIYKPAPIDNSSSETSSIANLLNGLRTSGIVQFIVSIIVSIILIWVIKKAFFTKRGDTTFGEVVVTKAP
jgi:carbonic anhydrase